MGAVRTPPERLPDAIARRLGPLESELLEDIVQLNEPIRRGERKNLEEGISAAEDCLRDLRKLGELVKKP
jgi:hypothetical protein